MKIIDAHCHIFPHIVAEKAVSRIGEFYSLPMRSSGTAETLTEIGKRAEISRFIVCSSATCVGQVRSINQFILSETLRYEQFTGLLSLHPDLTEEEVDFELDFGKKNGFKGIKLHPDFQKFNIDDEKIFKIYERAEGRFPILFHTGDEKFDYSNPARLIKIAKRYPRLICVAAHFGGYTKWEKAEEYAGLENVFFDTSSSLFKLDKARAVEIINSLGKDRFMFGTDFPMWDAFEELERFFDLGLSVDDNNSILFENAVKIYGL